MKMFKKGVCVCLAFLILTAGLPLMNIIAGNSENEKAYAVYDANPRNVSEEEGANAYPAADYEWNFGKDRIQGTSKVKYDEDTPYYLLEFSSEFDHDKVLIENGYMCNNGGADGALTGKISSGYMGWLQYPEMIRAIKDYLYITYDVYVEDTENRTVTLSISPMHQYEMDPWSTDPAANCGLFDRYEITENNKWITRSVKINSIAASDKTKGVWAQGDIFIQAAGIDGKPLNVKIRGLRLEVKESDRENISRALAAVQNIDKKKNFTTYFWSENDALPNLPKDSAGKTDYFSMLTVYDAESEYSPNSVTSSIVNDTTDVNGTAEVSAEYAKSGAKVDVTVSPAEGYKLGKLIVKDAEGNNVAAKRTGINTFQFIMPYSKTSVCAQFVLNDTTDDTEYVIWDANAERYIDKSGAQCKITDSWTNEQTVGSVTAVDDLKAYYEIVLNKNGGSKGVAAVNSGLSPHFGPSTGWNSDQKLTEILLPYLYMEFEARRTDAGTANPQYKVGMAAVWADGEDSQFGVIDAGDALNTERNVWHSYSFSNMDPETAQYVCDVIGGHWSDGAFRFGAYGADSDNSPSADAPVTVDIRSMRLVLRDADRLEINQYLADSGYTPGGSYFFNTAAEAVGNDENGNKDYFSLLTSFDEQSAYSKNYEDRNVTVKSEAAEGSISVNKLLAKPNMQITVTAQPKDGYRLSQVIVQKTDGTVYYAKNIRGNKAYFGMPDSDITVSAVFVKKSSNIQLVFQAEPVTCDRSDTKPEFSGNTELVSADGKCAAWKFKYGETIGDIIVKGTANRYYPAVNADSELTFYAKAVSSGNKILVISNEEGSASVQVTLTDKWTFYRVKVGTLFETAPDKIKLSLQGAAKDDELYISECDIWSGATGSKSLTDLYEETWDMSSYTVEKTNEQIGIMGDPDSDVSPWEEITDPEEKSKLGWSLAWYELFKGESPWFIGFKPENFGEVYSMGFYHQKSHELCQSDMSEWVETGYLEFYIKSDTDGICIPFNIEAVGEGSTHVPLKVVYKKAKARSDGYMKVQIPLAYMYAMGLDLSCIRYIQIRGIQEVSDDFYLSSFRFYSNPAPDKPDPVIEEEEPVVYSFNIDGRLFSGKIDHKTLTLSVPHGTMLWELLAGLRFDTLDMNILIKNSDGYSISDENTVLDETMTMLFMQDGYIVDEYRIILTGTPIERPVTDNNGGNSVTDTNLNGGTPDKTVTVKKRGVKRVLVEDEGGGYLIPIIIAVSAVIAAAAAITVVLVVRKKKTAKRSILK